MTIPVKPGADFTLRRSRVDLPDSARVFDSHGAEVGYLGNSLLVSIFVQGCFDCGKSVYDGERGVWLCAPLHLIEGE